MHELVERIYAAAADRSAWAGILEELSGIFRSTGAFRVADSRGFPERGAVAGEITDMVVSGMGDAELASFRRHYWALSPVLPQILRHPEGRVASIYDFSPERDFMASEYYADWLAPQRLHYSVGARFRVGANTNAMVALARSRRAGDYTGREIEQINRLIPHIRQSFGLGQHLHALSLKARGLQALLEQNGTVAVSLTRGGRIDDVSGEAEGLLRRIGIDVRDGLITLANPLHTQAVRAAARRVAESGIGERVVLSAGTDRARPVMGRLSPLATGANPLGAGARVLLVVEGALEPSNGLRDAVQEFGLTDAEARLALALVDGIDVAGYCERHEVSRNTVKTQLRSIFDKTGVRRQVDLVRLLRR